MDAPAPSPKNTPAPLSEEARELAREVRRARKRAERKAVRLVEDRAACDEAETLRRQGELLKINLPALPRGQDEAIVADCFAPPPHPEVHIPLDPARPPKETMAKLFKKAAKLERGRDHIETQIERNHLRLEALRALEAQLHAWRDTPAPVAEGSETLPDAIREEAARLGLLASAEAPAAKGAPRSRKETARDALMAGVRIFASRDGRPIWVGKSARDNDALTFRLARGNDWWFHLAPAAGSHVVVPNPGGGALPQETLLDAAHLAVHFSKMRGATKTDVTYTQARHVRRIRGAPPGKVRVERSETLFLRREPDRLARLLAPRD